MTRRDGNAAKRVVTEEPPPWRTWREKDRAKRAIRFIELYCIPNKGYGAGKPLKLAPFQKDWLHAAYSPDVDAATMKLPRGNGKSTFLGAVATHALFDEDDTGAPQVPVVATTIQQAIRTTYGAALAFVKGHPVLEERALIYSAIGGQKIITPHNSGEMFPVSNDPDGLQGLDPSLGVCDEVGFMPVESWDSLLLASGKRARSLVVGIGTPGFDRNNALWHLESKVKSGDAPDRFLFTAYEADENCAVTDESQWEKANPALVAGYMNRNALHTAVALSPEAHFRIFRLGQWVDGVECWLGDDGRALWRGLIDPWEMDPNAPTWVGVDVALRHDSTAIAWVQPRDGRWHVKAKIWQPREDGKLDVSDAMQFIRDLCAMYDVKQVAFDPRFFDLPATQLFDEGFPMFEVPQSLERMTPAIGATYEAIKRSEISHDGDEHFETQVMNAVARYNERGFTLAKSKSRGRIDAAIAMCIAVHAASQPEGAPVEVMAAWA